jgi:hypothetical protein
MRRMWRFALALALVAAATGLIPTGSAARDTPLWVKHIQNFPGGISNGVRARLATTDVDASTRATTRQAAFGTDVLANEDCDPPLPQNETAVAINPSDPENAVAAANDYCGDGFWIGATFDGGQTWTSTFKDPKLSNDARCFGSDPSVVYSRRDSTFYLSTLCYAPADPSSEVQVWSSADGGLTWTDSLEPAVAISNIAGDGSIDATIFYDKELLAVDNNVGSPHYGRLYLTFIKFHMTLPSGRSDYCPTQLASTDPSGAPANWVWSHTSVRPDAPGAHGVGPSANQWAQPVVDDTGDLDIGYAIEECNTTYNPAMFFTRSTDGGATFSSPVRIDKPGQFEDNASRQDILPAKHARIGLSPSMAFDPTSDRLYWVYQNNIDEKTGANISLQTSDDFGATWSDASDISVTEDGDAAPNDQFFPWLAIDETDGHVHAIWYDNRNDPRNKFIETFVGISTDGGDTWENVDISDVAWNPDKSFFTCGCFIGDYNAIAVIHPLLYPVWTDGRNSPGQPLGQTDIFTDVMNLEE